MEALRPPQHPDRTVERAFGGVNVFGFGDFWQLHPTGDVAFATNTLSCIGLGDVDRTMAMFWHKSLEGDSSNFHLQAWHTGSRVWELSENLRSGDDAWFSDVLDQCRQGHLLE